MDDTFLLPCTAAAFTHPHGCRMYADSIAKRPGQRRKARARAMQCRAILLRVALQIERRARAEAGGTAKIAARAA